MVMGVASSATAHVQDMVAKRNTARRGKKRGGGVGGAICRGRSEHGAAGQYSAGRNGRGFKTSNACRGFRVEGGVVENSEEVLGLESPCFLA